MHRALQIPEIVQFICQDLDPKSALSASTTCKDFIEPSLDALWYSIDSFEPIFYLLPGDLWRKECVEGRWGFRNIATVLHLMRQPTALDLHRHLTYYASRIREIHVISYNRMTMPSPQALQALQLATVSSDGSLTPLLKTFGWYDFDCVWLLYGERLAADLLSCTSLFASANTRSFIYTASPNALPKSVISPPSSSMPNLTELALQTEDDSLIHAVLMSSSWAHLETLTIDTIGAKDIAHLSSLPRLAKLYVGGLPDLGSGSRGAATVTFASLNELIIWRVRVGRAAAFLRYIDQRNTIQSFVCESRPLAATSESQDLINAISAHLNPENLKHLQIIDGQLRDEDLRGIMPTDFVFRQQDDAEFVQETDITPLFAFKKLEFLMFCVKGRAQVTPEVAARIAESWPLLGYLDVCGTRPIEKTPSIDHRHLSIILEGCPQLKHLGLPFDATRIRESERLRYGPFSKLSALHVCDAPINSTSRVGSFIETNFPQLEDLDVQHAWAWMDCKNQMRWDAVAKGFGFTPRWPGWCY